MSEQPKPTEAKCPKCRSRQLSTWTSPCEGLIICGTCGWEFPFPIGLAAEPTTESEQPNAAPGKRIPPWARALLVISKWMDSWEVVPPVPRNTVGVAALRNLHDQLFVALQEDEQIRADLLAACEEFSNAIPDYYAMTHMVLKARAAIAKAKETDR